MLSFMSDEKKEKERAVEREEKKGERKGDARRGDEEKIARIFLTSRSNKASPLKTDHQTYFFQFPTCFSDRGKKPKMRYVPAMVSNSRLSTSHAISARTLWFNKPSINFSFDIQMWKPSS